MKPSRLRRISLIAIAGWGLGASLLASVDNSSRLINLSSRASVGQGGDILIAGFVIGGDSSKEVLIRAVGPGLTKFGVDGVLAQPKLQLFDANGAQLSTNEKWDPALKAKFSQVGAFALTDGSRDAAVSVVLPPGGYTAQVSGLSASGGVALVELYDVSGSARLINLSTRTHVGVKEGLLISGIVVAPGSATRRLLVRAAGPSLQTFGVTDAVSDPALAILDSRNQQFASNDDWSDTDAAGLSTVTAAAGAFPFSPASKDSAVLVDLSPGSYSIQVNGVGNASGVTLVEVYDLTPVNSLPSVGVSATVSVTDVSGGAPGVFTFTRSGDLSVPLTATYSISGDATAGKDFSGATGTVTFASGSSTSSVTVSAIGDGAGAQSRTLTVTLGSGAGYAAAGNKTASMKLIYQLGSLYIARLRTPESASGSTASGLSTIQLSADEKSVIISVSFSNLSSPETVAYLRLGTPGDNNATALLRLPAGQATGVSWTIGSVGDLTAADIVKALKENRVFVSVGTAVYPDGELTGPFLRGAGSQTFVTPSAPPAVDLNAVTPAAASRFLIQATFGPKLSDIDAVAAKGYSAWIDEQIAKPATLHREATMEDFRINPPKDSQQADGNAVRPGPSNRQAGWFKVVIDGEDQLRQRVAFALSEIFVLSDADFSIGQWQEGTAAYYDILVKNAFGNYRTLLEQVSLNPMMGVYLSHLRNAKKDPKTGAMPDENYAREIMQLFSIGLVELQPDGTLRLDAEGRPIPTYDQTTITEMARVFTGWSYYAAGNNASFRSSPADRFSPMMAFPAHHDDGEKHIVNGVIIPAGQGAQRDLSDTLDALARHPNTPSFISRRLIQRLVTSNPSPGYVYRVARVFENNGKGERGDLGAVVRAILLDYEARSPEPIKSPSYGKLREPIIRLTALLRAGDGYAEAGRYYNPDPEVNYGQAALRSPTVFNFFEPDYVQPGTLGEAGLYAPEFQIHNDSTAISVPNGLHEVIFVTKPTTKSNRLRLTDFVPLADQPGALVDRIGLIFAPGQLRSTTRARVLTALEQMPAKSTTNDKIKTALYLIVTSPEGSVQK